MSLRRRLALTSGVAVALAVALASVIVYFVVRGQLEGQLDDSLRDSAEGTRVTLDSSATPVTGVPAEATSSAPDAVFRPARKLRPVFREAGGGRKGIRPAKSTKSLRPSKAFHDAEISLPTRRLADAAGYTQVVTASGAVLRASGETGIVVPSDDASVVASGKRDAHFSDVSTRGGDLRVFTRPAGEGVAIQVARPVGEVQSSLRTLVWTLLAVTVGGALLAGGVGYLVARRTMAPVRELTEAAEHVARTRDLGRRIGTGGRDDELARLAASFDAMLVELEQSAGAQRRLVADASHELRTPLTSLRTNIDVLKSGVTMADRDREALLADVAAEIEQLGVLVGDIVDLARDEEMGPEVREELRFDELVTAAVGAAERRSADVGFALDVEPVTVRGAPEQLARAVSNLLDNATKWSAPGSVVEVRLRGGELTVRDHGPGIDDADLPFVFDRFYRAASARGMPGSGLGLSIVRQAAEVHGGSVAAEAAPGGGALMRLALPVAGAERSGLPVRA